MLNPFSALGAKLFGGLSLALALTSAGLLVRGNYWQGRADGWEATAGKWKDAQQAHEAAYIAAQKSAADAAHTARLATEEQSRLIAERADHEDLDAARAAAARFADARRVQDGATRSAGSPASSAGAASQADAAPRSDGPGADAVVLSRAEFDQLTGNTLRLEQVRRWGQSLVDAGLAAVAR